MTILSMLPLLQGIILVLGPDQKIADAVLPLGNGRALPGMAHTCEGVAPTPPLLLSHPLL
jgi:hypothetical protein